MKNTLIGFLILITILSLTTLAWAAWQRFILIDSNEVGFGTSTNPIYVQGV